MDCKNCTGGGCAACGAALELTREEICLLRELAVYAFLPVARRPDDMTPFYPEGADMPQALYTAVMEHLQRKGLIDLDYDAPIGSYSATGYACLPIHGSMALTERGQQVVDALDILGLQDDKNSC